MWITQPTWTEVELLIKTNLIILPSMLLYKHNQKEAVS